MLPLAIAIVLIPLVASLLCALVKNRFSWIAPIIASLLQLITLVVSLILLFTLTTDSEITTPWLTINTTTITLGFSLNRIVITMVVVVVFVSFLVHLFSIGYMADDDNAAGYFSMLSFFTFAMVGLVISNNLLVTFCFWELVGYSSYRLIGHWHERPAAARASTKAFLINKVGDLGFLIGLMILWSTSGSLEISSLTSTSSTPVMTIAGLCLFMGVIGKSAQFPLFHWLPDAMEGPTPVSALIHAATMVAAGVFLMIRLEPMFTHTTLAVMAAVGATTALLGALGALVQFDIKKILAYSTISQLGLMVMAIGSGSTQGGFEHLLHHAFFKAGLFLGSGSIIHALHQAIHHDNQNFNAQDIRNLGGLRKKMPVTFLSFTVCTAALAGLPLTAGFNSKEVMLTHITQTGSVGLILVSWVVTWLSAVYSFRLLWYSFFGKSGEELQVQEVPLIMRIALVLLSIGSVSFLWYDGKLSTLTNVLLRESSVISTPIALASIGLVGFGLITGYLLFRNKPNKSVAWLEPQLYFDWISARLVSVIQLLASIAVVLDRNWIDRLLHGLVYLQVALAFLVHWIDNHVVDGVVNGTSSTVRGVSWVFRTAGNGKIQSYLLWTMAGLVIFILWILN